MYITIISDLLNNTLYNKALLIILIISFLIEIFYYLYFYSCTTIYNHKKAKKQNYETQKPSVSVIICAKNEATNLENFLPLTLEQEYPEYEVIVVNDGSWDNSEELLVNLKKLYPNLYFTTIPQNSRIISHKKLAITVGIKAAKNEILLFTDADCRPLTPHWISEMVQNFQDETEFVLGYGGYYSSNKILSKIISYDTLFIAMQYFGFAYRGIPYMGVGRNIAYRKSTFINRKGFAGFLHIPSGDDDLLVNNFGNSKNTAIECTSKAKTLSLPEISFKDWFHQKKRHLGTVSAYTSKSKLFISLEPVARGAFYISIILLLFNPNIIISNIIFVVALFSIRFITQLLITNITSKHLKEKNFYFSIILLDILLPITTIILMLSRKFTPKRKRNIW